MQEWVRQQNIAEFRKLLATKIDAEQRRVLLQLLKEEQAKESPLPRAKLSIS
jgi:hypothetical protein